MKTHSLHASRMSASTLLSWLLLLQAAARVSSYAAGSPGHRCSNLVPAHRVAAQSTQPPYQLVLGRDSYSPGDRVNVTLRGIGGARFKGFAIAARRLSGDTEELVGQFLTAEAAKGARWYSSAAHVNNCATHNSPADKEEITVIWIAPNASVGDVVFTTPVVQTISIFWSNISSSELAAEKPSADPPFPGLIIDRSRKLIGSCGSDFGCVTTPAGCSADANCNAQIKFRSSSGGRLQFELLASGSYVAVGFSRDDRMRDDLTVTCTSEQRLSIQLGYNPAVFLRNERHRWTQLQDRSIEVSNNEVWCQFTLPEVVKLTTFLKNREENFTTDLEFDLRDEYFVFLANGDVYSGSETAVKHRELPAISTSSVSLTSNRHYSAHRIYGYKKGHASMMLLAWLLLAPLAANLAMFHRSLLTVQVAGAQLWFQLHRLLAVAAYGSTALGLVLILAAFGWQWPAFESLTTFHSIMGLIVMTLATAQILMGVLRPDKDSPNRSAFKLAHQIAAALAFGFADGNMILIGFFMALPSGYRVIQQTVAITWCVYNATFKITVPLLVKRWQSAISDAKQQQEQQQQQMKLRNRLVIILCFYTFGAVSLLVAALVGVNIY